MKSKADTTIQGDPAIGEKDITASPRLRRWEFPAVASASLLLVLVNLTSVDLLMPDDPEFAAPADHHKYIYMAEHGPFRFHVAPFCRRVLTPLIVSMLPVDTTVGFLSVALVSLWATGVAFYYLLRAFDLSPFWSGIGMLFYFSLGWATRFPLSDFWLTDSLAILFMIAGIRACRLGNWVALMLILLAGVTLKETVLFVSPLYVTLATAAIPLKQRLTQCLIATLPAALMLAVLWWAIPARNNDPGYTAILPEEVREVDSKLTSEPGLLTRVHDIGLQRIVNPNRNDIYAYTVGTFGVSLLVLPLFNLRESMRLFWSFLPLTLLAYAQLLVATDTQRLIIIAFPALILIALSTLMKWSMHTRVRPIYLAVLPLALVAANSFWPERVHAPSRVQLVILVVFLAIYWIASNTLARKSSS